MPTENTYQSIPSLRKIEIEYLAWQITRMQAGIREFIGQRKRTSVSGGRTWKDGSRKVGYNVTSDRAKSSTGWKTCISAP
ncbi:hypothetical protein [Parabacteroides distasonis]|uniref:hypothetical protein n=1 Tax=Parabacteroides distasonis TaxID=823 RepID=UPI002164C5E2|nr:hypothetical protein [Parabacteroides distasonis]UVR14501.1 hypothetical protein NXW68_03500 [Parabacteroides distasonis]